MDHAFLSHSFIRSGVSMKKKNKRIYMKAVLPVFHCFLLAETLPNENISLYFLSLAFVFCRRKNGFFLLPFSMEFEVWVSAKYAWNLIQLLCYRSAIVLLSCCFFHLQFIKINSYRYFRYDSPRKKKSRMVTATTKNEISNQEENRISFRIFWFDAREREWKKSQLEHEVWYGLGVCVCDYCVCVNCKG